MYVLYIVVCPFVLFLLAIMLSVLLRFTDSDYPFGTKCIFKLLLVIGYHARLKEHLSTGTSKMNLINAIMCIYYY